MLSSLLVAHFVISLGRDENFFELVTSSLYWPDLGFVTGITFFVIGVAYCIHRTLDRSYPIREHIVRRLLIQTCCGILLPVLICFILAYAYLSIILNYNFWKHSFLLIEFPVAVLMIITTNLFLLFITLLNSGKNLLRPIAHERKHPVLLLQ